MFICEFCSREFTLKHNLKQHQLKAKYCLEIQNKSCIQKEICRYCEKEFSYKHIKDSHEQICNKRSDHVIREHYENKLREQKEFFEYELKKKEEELREKYHDKLKTQKELSKCKLREQKEFFESELKKKEEHIFKIQNDNNERLLKETKENSNHTTEILSNLVNKQTDLLAQKPTSIKNDIKTTNTTINQKNNYINAMGSLTLTEEKIEEALASFSYDDFMKGNKTLLIKHLNKTLLVDENNKITHPCVDVSRKKFIYKDKNGNIITDKKANYLIDKLSNEFQDRIKNYIDEFRYKITVDNDDDNVMDKGLKKIRKLKNEFDIKSSGFIDALATENDIKKLYSSYDD